MKNKEFIKKYEAYTTDKIDTEILNRKEKINTLMFDATKGKIDNVREINTLRKEVAKLFTLAAEKK